MSFFPGKDPEAGDAAACDALEQLIIPRTSDIGGLEVRRALPTAKRRLVGPFIFFDRMGPALLRAGEAIDVKPHPHIGLSTVTYLFDGEIKHRDSLGTEMVIAPGDVNLMTAGIGITHSERTDGEMRLKPHALFGLQSWLALPKSHEDTPADFRHVPKDDLPELEGEGKQLRLILGKAWGAEAPVPLASEAFYADAVLAPGAALPLPDNHEDRGVYVLEGEVSQAGTSYEAGQMLIFRPGDAVSVKAGPAGARIMILGGATMDGPRFIWWNFVASSRERIEAAKEAWRAGDWAHGRFSLPPGDDKEFIPAPEK